MRYTSRLAGLLALTVSLFVTTVLPAQASVPTTSCNGRSYTYVVKAYTRGAAALPLRCGTSTWGFQHITARWNAGFDATIALTVSRGEAVADEQQDGGSTIYALFDDQCNELFRVIYNSNAYLGNDVRPQGIITAFEITQGGPAVAQRVTDTTPAYRTDCPVVQTI